MKPLVFRAWSVSAVLSLALFGAMVASRGAPANAKTARSKTAAVPPASTNAVALPQSAFVIPPTVKDGRDPFFPQSIRVFNERAPVSTNTPVTTVNLVWNGTSGTGDNRLVMINGYTFAQGETHEIPTSSGRVKVRCVEIKADAVILEVNGAPRELRMKEEKVLRDAEGLKVSGK